MTFDSERPTDSLNMGFRALESLNEVGLAPEATFLLQPSRDIEVLTYVREGTLTQKDCWGKTRVLEVGECGCSGVQSGTKHRADNRSLTQYARAFQCIVASGRGSPKPRSERRRFPFAERRGILRLMASPDGKDGSLRMDRDIRIYSSVLEIGHHLIHELAPGRGAWLHVVKGRIQLFDHALRSGDGASLVEEPAVSWTAQESSEILLLDLA